MKKRGVFLLFSVIFILLFSVNAYADHGGVCLSGQCDVGSSGACSVGEICEPDPPGSNCGTCVIDDDDLCCYGPGCGPGCAPPNCGDEIRQTGEVCDDGNLVNGDGCSQWCTDETCGNGVLESGVGETCDDGNTNNGDGCSAICQIEPGQCDDGLDNEGDGLTDWDGLDGIDGNLDDDPQCTWIWTLSEGSTTQVCETDDVIFKISINTNAHAELYDETNYNIDICYNDFFPDLGITPDRTDNGFDVLRLSDDTNAHVEGPDRETTRFQTIHYENLNCHLENVGAGNVCSVGTKIAALSSTTNAHIETHDAGNYPYALCCSLGDSTPIGPRNAEWRNVAGTQEIGESAVNKTVALYVTSEFPNSAITLAIKEEDGILDDNIRTLSGTTDSNGNFLLPWKITDADISAGDGIGEGNELEFYFVSTIGSVSFKTTDFLQGFDGILHTSKESGSDNPPIARISAPKHLQIYYVGVPLEFNHTSIDDGVIDVFEWVIETKDGLEHQTGEESFRYTFSEEGQRTITLKVTDDSGQIDEDQIAILIMDTPGMIAFVNKPFHQQIVQDNFGGVKHQVSFSGEESYLLDSVGTGCAPVLTCIAGFCPAHTYTPPQGCTANITINDATPNDPEWDQVIFDWVFRDDQIEISLENAGYNGTFAFGKRSGALNDKDIDLTLTSESGALSGSTEEEFEINNREFTLGQCLSGGNKFYHLDGDGNVDGIFSTSDPGVCTGQDGLIGTADDCCPTGFQCQDDGTGNGIAVCVDTGVRKCADYTPLGQSVCENDPSSVAEMDPAYTTGSPLFCGGTNPDGSIVQCFCGWDEGTSGGDEDDKCALVSNYVTSGTGPNLPCSLGQCQITADITSECNNGVMTISPTGQFITGNCADSIYSGAYDGEIAAAQTACLNSLEPRQVACGQFNFELPFFGMGQFIVSILIIMIVYSLVILRRKED